MTTAVHTIAAEDFGSLVRTRRKEMGMTQQQVATAIGVQLRTVQLWEAGQEPYAGNFMDICRLLEIDPATAYHADTRVCRASRSRKT